MRIHMKVLFMKLKVIKNKARCHIMVLFILNSWMFLETLQIQNNPFPPTPTCNAMESNLT